MKLDTPITITRHYQPSTVETWKITEISPVEASEKDPSWIQNRAAKGWINVIGEIVEGSEVSRLFSASSVKEYKGQILRDQIPPEFLVDGASYITVNM